MPNFKSAKTLEKLCLRNIFMNMDDLWCADYRVNYMEKNGPKFSFIQGPFNEVDARLVQKLLQMLMKHKRICKVYLHLLIVPTLTEIDLSGAAKYVTDEIVGLITMRCCKLTRIELTRCDRVSSKRLGTIVQKFHETLRKICFTSTKLNDDILEMIGTCCQRLTSLNVSMTKFTENGIKKLLYTDDNHTLTPVGKSLKILKMMGCEFEDDAKFMALMLVKCKSLRCVTHFSIWKSIAILCYVPRPLKLGLTGVRYDMTLDLWSLQDYEEMIPEIPKLLPELQHLSIYDVEGMDEMHLFHFLSECGKTLLSLKIDWMFPYDFIPYIGLLCPQLDTLILTLSDYHREPARFCKSRKVFQKFISDNDIISKNKRPWSELSELMIYWPPPDSELPAASSTPVLSDIFRAAASTLSYVSLQWMPDANIDDFLVWCLNEKYMENVSHLFLHGCQHLAVDVVWQIVKRAPVLKYIDYCDCPLIKLEEYITMGNWAAKQNFALSVENNMF